MLQYTEIIVAAAEEKMQGKMEAARRHHEFSNYMDLQIATNRNQQSYGHVVVRWKAVGV